MQETTEAAANNLEGILSQEKFSSLLEEGEKIYNIISQGQVSHRTTKNDFAATVVYLLNKQKAPIDETVFAAIDCLYTTYTDDIKMGQEYETGTGKILRKVHHSPAIRPSQEGEAAELRYDPLNGLHLQVSISDCYATGSIVEYISSGIKPL